MKKAIKLTIAAPCHENWNEMTKVEQGKHCKVCSKNVVDFTKKSDEEIYKYVAKNNNICGRFKETQLDRDIKLARKSGFNLKPYAASLLLPLSLLSSVSVNAKAEVTSEKNHTSIGIGRFADNTSKRAQIITTGTVYDNHGNPLANVKITSNETEATTWTAKDGSYKIVTLDHEILSFSKLGFIQKKEKRTNKSEELTISLTSETLPIAPLPQILGIIAVNPTILEKPEMKTIIVKGTVRDDTGLPLPGTTIVIKGTTRGTQTDFEGNYSIETIPNQTLVFSYVGFDTKEITLSTISNTIDIQMSYDITGEVVIVGGVVSTYYEDPEPSAEERAEKKRSQQIAEKNNREFQRLQHEKKKAARKAKRNNKSK